MACDWPATRDTDRHPRILNPDTDRTDHDLASDPPPNLSRGSRQRDLDTFLQSRRSQNSFSLSCESPSALPSMPSSDGQGVTSLGSHRTAPAPRILRNMQSTARTVEVAREPLPRPISEGINIRILECTENRPGFGAGISRDFLVELMRRRRRPFLVSAHCNSGRWPGKEHLINGRDYSFSDPIRNSGGVRDARPLLDHSRQEGIAIPAAHCLALEALS